MEREKKVKEQAKKYYENRGDLPHKGKEPTSYDYSDVAVNAFPHPFIKYKIIPAEE